MTVQSKEKSSPWRRLFEDVRKAAGNRRDEHGVQGSINWLRKQMELRGANPNVVRNIVYRDKGRLADKRVLFEVLGELWQRSGNGPLRFPEIEVLLSRAGDADTEIVRILGREKRQVYRAFVSGVRSGEFPKMTITGRPGSGKTLLVDYVQEALEAPPQETERMVRMEFGSGRLDTGLIRLAVSVGVPAELIEAKITKVGASGAFSVQADAQAEVARLIVDCVRSSDEPLIILSHVSRSSAASENLGTTPLRLNTPEVPRVSAAEWLWLTLFAPLAALPSVSMLVSMSELPARALTALGDFGEPVRLSPPTINEARRFVRARLPDLDAKQQESVVRKAGRSFEELRTLTLLTEARVPPVARNGAHPEDEAGAHIDQLGSLVTSTGDERLRDFLSALAVLSLPEFPTISMPALRFVRTTSEPPTLLEMSFLDAVPPDPERYRPFSRGLVRGLRQRLQEEDPAAFRNYSNRSADYYAPEAQREPGSEEASRYLQHLFQARSWPRLIEWLERAGLNQSLMPQLWSAARVELPAGPPFERLAHRVAWHYVRLGAYEHPQALEAFSALEGASDHGLRTWSLIQRAEGAILRGQVKLAEELLDRCGRGDGTRSRREDGSVPDSENGAETSAQNGAAGGARADDHYAAEIALVRASLARWRGNLQEGARLVEEVARPRLAQLGHANGRTPALKAKAAVWACLIAKDQGDTETALRELEAVSSDDDLVEARVAFQRGDLLLSLGRFDAALRALDLAVDLGREGQALMPEQSRYLSRRGTLHRKRGALDRSLEDFQAAARLLNTADEHEASVEREFWLARSEDEHALALLALGRFEEAVLTLERNIATFERYGKHFDIDPSFRVLRGTLRLAIAYLYRSLGQPYRHPLARPVEQAAGRSDLEHSRKLVGQVLESLSGVDGRRFFRSLLRDALQLASLLDADPHRALALARDAQKEARGPHQLAESRAYAAAACLRAGKPASAAEECSEAAAALAAILTDDESGDVGLRAWLTSLSVQAVLQTDGTEAAATRLQEALRDDAFEQYHPALLRMFGEQLEEFGVKANNGAVSLASILGADLELEDTRVRLPDALSGWWSTRDRNAKGRSSS